MQISNSVKFWGAFLSLNFFGFGFCNSLYNFLVSNYAENNLTISKKSLEQVSQKIEEKAWGHVGALAYQAGNQLMASNNAKPQGLDEICLLYTSDAADD